MSKDTSPPALRDDIEAWDPPGTARLILAFATPWAEPVDAAGRTVYGARPAAWAALEDKVRVDAFWDAVGVRRAPSRVVPADYETLTSAAAALDRGLGTVWAADVREGIHGGALGLRWARRGDDGAASFASLRRMADRVRVMPFLEGIPASIHGIVFPDSVAVFRPVEMVALRPTTGDRLFYAGCATAFDPHPGDREAMRDLARRVGAALRETVGYRGPFGIDGVPAEEQRIQTISTSRSNPLQARSTVSAGTPCRRAVARQAPSPKPRPRRRVAGRSRPLWSAHRKSKVTARLPLAPPTTIGQAARKNRQGAHPDLPEPARGAAARHGRTGGRSGPAADGGVRAVRAAFRG